MLAALRPMVPEDAPAVLDCMRAAFADLDRRLGIPAAPEPERSLALVRIRHLIATDPGGAMVAEAGGSLAGASLALLRDGLWGLSLLVVMPGRQSSGIGSGLLRAALDYGEGARGALILGSEDARALRAYHRAGFTLSPAMDARGAPSRRPEVPPGVREGRWPDDREVVDGAGVAVRGAGHGADVPAWLEAGARLLVHDGGGFAVHSGATVRCVAATREDVAADLLRAALAAVPAGERARCDFITAGQDWAVGVLLEAGLTLHPAGAVFTRGEVGPLRPYIPNGAYL